MAKVKHRYAKVSRRVWSDAAVRELSGPEPNGLSLWLWLLTTSRQSLLPGLIPMGEAGMAEELGWSLKGFREAFGEVSRKPLAKANWHARLVWIPKAIEHNEPASCNVIRSWAHAWDELPECDLKDEAYQELRGWSKAKGKAWLKAFDEACPKPCGNQEQDQEQDQEQKDPPLGPPQGGTDRDDKPENAPKLGKPRGHRIPDDWQLTNELVAYGTGNRRTQLPTQVVRDCAEDFREHFRNSTGRNATKLNWDLAFKGWLRRHRRDNPRLERFQKPPPMAKPPTEPNEPLIAVNPLSFLGGPTGGIIAS